jgi:hypothetical protein
MRAYRPNLADGSSVGLLHWVGDYLRIHRSQFAACQRGAMQFDAKVY